MNEVSMPPNGSQVHFRRFDDDQWKDGEYDEQNQMFIEIYSSELTTHNQNDISEWKYLD